MGGLAPQGLPLTVADVPNRHPAAATFTASQQANNVCAVPLPPLFSMLFPEAENRVLLRAQAVAA